MSYPYQETKERWFQMNKVRVNARRRELRKLKKSVKMEGKYCLLCEIRMAGNSYGTRVYCKDCNTRYPDRVRRHKWTRSYRKRVKAKSKNIIRISRDERFNPQPI